LDRVILAFLLPTTLKRYCIQIFRGPLFSRTCQARDIREIKGTWKNGFYSMPRHCRRSTHSRPFYLEAYATAVKAFCWYGDNITATALDYCNSN